MPSILSALASRMGDTNNGALHQAVVRLGDVRA